MVYIYTDLGDQMGKHPAAVKEARTSDRTTD